MTYWYLASPYSKYPHGLGAAFSLACREAGRLMKARIPVFSPIAHTHPIAGMCAIDPLAHEFWMATDKPMMDAARGLIMLQADGWWESKGMQIELETFRAAGKPVTWMVPGYGFFELKERASEPHPRAVEELEHRWWRAR